MPLGGRISFVSSPWSREDPRGGLRPPGVTCDGVGYLVRIESQLHQAQAVVIIVPEVLVELGIEEIRHFRN